MRPIAFQSIGLCFVLALFTAPATEAPAATRVRVLCYNIHHGEGTDRILSLERIARVVNELNPDVVALQEVDDETDRTRRVDQAAELGRLTRMTPLYGKNIDYAGGGYGNAILSRWPVKLCENLALPSLDIEHGRARREQRGVLIAEVTLPAGGRFVFAVTHLDARPPDEERFESARFINAHFGSFSERTPVLLAGDLNATRDSRVLKELRRKWKVVGDVDIPTVPSGEPRRQIDFILCRPQESWREIEIRVLPEAVASDHRPLLADLELAGSLP